jgi:hypothetical protein
MILRSIYSIAGGIMVDPGKWIVYTFACAILSLIILTSYRRYKEEGASSLYLPFVLLFSLTVLFTILGSKLYSVRHVVFLSPFLLTCLSVSLNSRQNRLKSPVKYVVPLLVSIFIIINIYSSYLWYFKPQYQTQNFKGLAMQISSQLEPEDVIVIVPKYQHFPFMYYFRKPNKILILNPSDLPSAKDEILLSRRVWWIFAGDEIQDPDRSILKWMNEHFQIKQHFELPNLKYEITGDKIEVYAGEPATR